MAFISAFGPLAVKDSLGPSPSTDLLQHKAPVKLFQRNKGSEHIVVFPKNLSLSFCEQDGKVSVKKSADFKK
jgi:hypothetical protein